MTSTPHFDRLVQQGTGGRFSLIRLVEGHALSVKIEPGATEVYEVCPFPTVRPDNTVAWENEDSWEGRLTGEGTDGGPLLRSMPVQCPLYMDVPVEAVRELIIQHGGEADEQDRPVYRVTVQRTEIIQYVIEADSPEDAQARYLADGVEVGVESESIRIASVTLDEQ
ncbi:hypothetical protein NW249_23335 [Streptomyces sp. OUCMDZ-4982]|uniref:hypothetical protein n=1 Tax=Streptomyces sp. OUCMDZ-4982 TaxID=2973090 RepID=UPI00215CB7AB|nr:hypothetical protein [Streptomyces sp. OUCMDZ-4982]MCR8945055.1 hypothetical protein [Streptomyces sp. OUCMDZ-4982]